MEDERRAFDPARAGHDDVHHDHVGLLRAHFEDRVAHAARLRNDLDVVLRLQHGRRPARTTAWSSTRTTRITERDLGDDRRASLGRRFDGEAAVQERDPLAHPDEAEAAVAGLVRREADAVVLDHGSDGVPLAGHEHAHPGGPGVLDHVRQRLLDDAVERGLDRRG